MPELSEVSYSREATVAAFRDYYDFLTSMYLDPSVIIEPPEEGWPDLQPGAWPDLNKTEEVLGLLRRLPYIGLSQVTKRYHTIESIPGGQLADWSTLSTTDPKRTPSEDAELIKDITEPTHDDFYPTIPPHIIGITMYSDAYAPKFLLDTHLGLVYWPEWPGQVRQGKSSDPETIHSSGPDDWFEDGLIAEDQVEWREASGIWAIPDFFEMLKCKFRDQDFVPIGEGRVGVRWDLRGDEDQRFMEVKRLYQEYGWPNEERFRRGECHQAIREMFDSRFPEGGYRYP